MDVLGKLFEVVARLATKRASGGNFTSVSLSQLSRP